MPKTFRLGKGAQLQTPKTRSVAANAKAKLTLDKYFTSDRCCACGAIMAAVAGLSECLANLFELNCCPADLLDALCFRLTLTLPRIMPGMRSGSRESRE